MMSLLSGFLRSRWKTMTVRMKVLMMIQSGGHEGVVMGRNHGLKLTIGGIYYNPK
jgi:hypothetical protein